jgi:hypothetical protein
MTFLIYVLIGTVCYPAAIDMWYRLQHKREKFPSPEGIQWYLGFIIFTLGWVVAYPILIHNYLKEMSE